MIKLTIKDALEQTDGTDEHYIYLYRDRDVMLYVGRSFSPLDRMEEHIGIAGRGVGSSLGDLIKDNMPDSLSWTIELYTLNECIALVQKPYNLIVSKEMEKASEDMRNIYLYQTYADDIEQAMIDHFKPCLNIMGRRYSNPLPDRYIKRKISNKGVKLG